PRARVRLYPQQRRRGAARDQRRRGAERELPGEPPLGAVPLRLRHALHARIRPLGPAAEGARRLRPGYRQAADGLRLLSADRLLSTVYCLLLTLERSDMTVGVPKEIKESEYRVALVSAGAEALTEAGHTVLVEAGAGEGSGITDEEYEEHGATIVSSAAEIYERAELIVKVKEPLPEEYPLIRPGHVLFTYFHFAADEGLIRAMLERRAVCIAY